MKRRAAAEDGAGEEPWSEDEGDELPDEVDERAGEGDGLDEDDLPATHMSDDEYAAYASETFDAEGRERGAPPVAAILIGITLLVILVAVLLA